MSAKRKLARKFETTVAQRLEPMGKAAAAVQEALDSLKTAPISQLLDVVTAVVEEAQMLRDDLDAVKQELRQLQSDMSEIKKTGVVP